MTHKKNLPKIGRGLDRLKATGKKGDRELYEHIEQVHVAPALKESQGKGKRGRGHHGDSLDFGLPTLEQIGDGLGFDSAFEGL